MQFLARGTDLTAELLIKLDLRDRYIAGVEILEVEILSGMFLNISKI